MTTTQTIGTGVGGVVGGVLGSNVGDGRGRTTAIIGGTLIGAMLGGAVGKSMDEVDEMKARPSFVPLSSANIAYSITIEPLSSRSESISFRITKMKDMFPQTFYFLQQEGHLIRSSLTVGLTELRKANVHNKGAFYSSLFNLSVGTERLLKCIVIIEHMLQNQLAVPTKKELKAYGHDIESLYDKCQKISTSKGQPFPARSQLHPLE